MIDDDAVGQIMCENADDICDIIAVDGKAHSFLHILTTYATESGVTLAQMAISYTDAMGTQTKIA